MNDVLQYAAYVLVAIGVMAFLVSVITQVIKELPCFKPVPTAVPPRASSRSPGSASSSMALDFSSQ